MKAAALARRYKAKLIATEADRFVRRPSRRGRPSLAGEEDLRYLLWATEGVELVTLADPAAPASEQHGLKVQRDMQSQGPTKAEDAATLATKSAAPETCPKPRPCATQDRAGLPLQKRPGAHDQPYAIGWNPMLDAYAIFGLGRRAQGQRSP